MPNYFPEINPDTGEFLSPLVTDAIDARAAAAGSVGHNHDDHYYTEAEADGRFVQGSDPRLADARTPTGHSHPISGVTGLQTALDGKQSAGSYATAGHTHTAAAVTDLTETVQDIVGALLVAGVNTTITYDDTAGTVTINSTATGGGGETDPEIVRDVIGGALVAGAGIQITVNDAADTITVTSTAVQPTRAITAGTGLTGGGDLSANRSIAVDFGQVATAAQGAKADSASQPGHTHTLDQATDTATRLAMTPAERAKLGGVATSATANATDAQLRDRSTHTGTQPAASVTGLATVATSGAYGDLSGKPTLGTAAAAATGDFATAAQGAKADSAVQPAGLPTWTTIGGKPAVVADGADAAEARGKIGAVDQAAIDTAITGLINGAPGALDTLNELSSALGGDANFSATVAAALGNRLRVDTATQGLTTTQQQNARANAGIPAEVSGRVLSGATGGGLAWTAATSVVARALGWVVVTDPQYGAVGDYDGTTGTDNYAAFVAAKNACATGGAVFVPRGRYYLSDTFVLDKAIDFTCSRGGFATNSPGTQLIFAAGKTGVWVKENASSVKPSGWRVGPFEISSLSTAAGTDIGVLATNGQGTLDMVSVNGFGSHGIAFIAGANSPYPGNNVNNSYLARPRAYGNRGDGILIQGNDSQAHIILKPDVVANYGVGLNLDRCASVTVIAPHADQQFNGSTTAFRDSGNSNTWESVYSENGVRFVLDTNSNYARVTSSQYGRPIMVDNTVGKTALWLDNELGLRKQSRVTGISDGAVAMDVDQLTAGAARIRMIAPVSKDFLVYGSSSDTLFTAASKWRIGSGTSDPIFTAGTGSPEGTITATVGSVYQRKDGLAGATLYLKESGTGNTGWVPVGPVAPQPVNAQTGTSYTLVAADAGKLVTANNAAPVTVTVPASVFVAGQQVDLINLGAGQVTIAAGSGATVNGTPTLKTRSQYSALTIKFLTATSAVVVGDLAAS